MKNLKIDSTDKFVFGALIYFATIVVASYYVVDYLFRLFQL